MMCDIIMRCWARLGPEPASLSPGGWREPSPPAGPLSPPPDRGQSDGGTPYLGHTYNTLKSGRFGGNLKLC